jgi:phosphoribosylpyrophosphate synthetase
LEFSGSVEPGKDYILIDDVFSTSGFFSELGRYIKSREGKAVLADATATGGHGEKLTLSPQTAHLTLSVYTA